MKIQLQKILEKGIILPIDGSDILGFKRWINWNGFGRFNEYCDGFLKLAHKGLDFAAYLNNRSGCVLGLPAKTPVRAIADGIATPIYEKYCYGYSGYIVIRHDEEDDLAGVFSEYHHVVPLIGREGKRRAVKRGDVIATLYKDKGKKRGRLVHLHFSLTDGYGEEEIEPTEQIDPTLVYPDLSQLVAEPQGSVKFTVPQLNLQPRIRIANFRELEYSNVSRY